MRADSVRTAVEPGDVGRQHLLGPSVQMPVAEVQPIAEVHHLLQKIGSVGKALQYSGEFIPVRIRLAPAGHDLRKLAGGFAFGSGFDEGHRDNIAR